MQTHSIPLEIKAIGERKFEGYGSVFGNIDLGGDVVVRGAFKATLGRHKAASTMPLMFWMHQSDQVPGVWTDMSEDDNGLHVRGELVDTSLGREVRTLLEKKAVRGLSIGYVPVAVDFGRDGERFLKEIDLHEVSVVSMAMNPLARVESMKARLSWQGEYVPTERELERLFRGAGCSKSVARTLISRLVDTGAGGMPAPRRDAGDVEDDETELNAVTEMLARLTDLVGAEAIRRR